MTESKQKTDFWSVSVGHIPLQTPIIVTEDTSIEATIRDMQTKKTGCVLVINKDKALSGIVTGRDIMEKFIATDLAKSTPIGKFMSRKVLSLSPDTLISDVVIFLGKTSIRHIPICHDPKNILGLLSVRNLITFIAENLPEEVLNLPPYGERISTETFGA